MVRVEAYDRAGKPLRYVAKDFHARVVQHECDHLIGKVFVRPPRLARREL